MKKPSETYQLSVSLDEVEVGERIRRDMGDIDALAKDIEERGLINPITVALIDGVFILIAGERRLEAMKRLGWESATAFLRTVEDEEERLQLEISENELRKDFTPSERVEYGKRLERVEALKAKERQATSTGGAKPQLMENFPQAESEGTTRDKVAAQIGAGSGRQYEKMKAVYEEADPETFEKWDRGEMSTHKAFTITRHRQEDEENEEAETKIYPPRQELSEFEEEARRRDAEIDRIYGQLDKITDFFHRIYKAMNADVFSEEAIENYAKHSVSPDLLMEGVEETRKLMDEIEEKWGRAQGIRRIK